MGALKCEFDFEYGFAIQTNHIYIHRSIMASSDAPPQSASPPNPPQPVSNGPTLRGFIIGSLAACGAVTFTNPFEIVKTRLQLQGESLLSSNSTPNVTPTPTSSPSVSSPQPRPYRNVFGGFKIIIKQEGLRGLQRGLLPAYGYQTILNGIRLGMYAPLRDSISRVIGTPDGKMNNVVNLVAGGLVGVIGAFFSSPLFLVKTVRIFFMVRQIMFDNRILNSSPSLFIMLSRRECNLTQLAVASKSAINIRT
jgi:hypothetical protein